MKIKLIFIGIIVFLSSCSVKDSNQVLFIKNNTNDTVIIKYNTTTDNGVQKLHPMYLNEYNEFAISHATIFYSYYYDIAVLPLFTDNDLKDIIKELTIYKVHNKDTFKLDIDYNDISNWTFYEHIDDEIRGYEYTLNLDKNSD